MRVLLRESRVCGGFAQKPGNVIEVSDDEGQRMIAAGQAVPAGHDVPAGTAGAAVEVRGEAVQTAAGRPKKK